MKTPSAIELAPEYLGMWASMKMREERDAECVRACQHLQQFRDRYDVIAREFGMPWQVVAVLDQMESGGGCHAHLHNGDPLISRTRNVPAGRPVNGKPPFTWEESARDALQYDKVRSIEKWDVPRTLWFLEQYNGWGYRMRGVPSAYLWAGSNQYLKGRFVQDGVWNSESVSKQIGCAPLLRGLGWTGENAVSEQPFKGPSDQLMWTGRKTWEEMSMSDRLVQWILSKADWKQIANALWVWALETLDKYIDEEVARRKAEMEKEQPK